MKIGIGGCSHSSNLYGKAWWEHMAEDLNVPVVPTSSGASGNEKNIEKIKFILDEHPDTDLIIYQLTEPSRMVVGIHNDNFLDIKDYLNDTGSEKNDPYYSFVGRGNDDRIKHRYDYNLKFDDFFFEKIYGSEYNIGYKFFHTMMSLNYLVNAYNKKIIFWSWFLDAYVLAEKFGYTKILNNMCVLKGCAHDYFETNGIKTIDENNSHYGSESHFRLYHEFLKPSLSTFFHG